MRIYLDVGISQSYYIGKIVFVVVNTVGFSKEFFFFLKL